MEQRRYRTRTVPALIGVLALLIAGLLVFRRMDFSFVRGLSARSLLYILPLFIVYHGAAALSHALLTRDAGYSVNATRLIVELFAAYWWRILGATRAGSARMLPAASGMSVLYAVELGITIVIASLGFRYLIPESSVRSALWLGSVVVLLAAFTVFFHLSRRGRARVPAPGHRLAEWLADVRDAMRRTSVTTLCSVVGLALAKRLVLACTSYLILRDIGGYLPLKLIIYLQSSAILVGFVSMIPLGLGTRDVTSFFLYAHLGLPPEAAVVMAAFERLIWTLVPLCLGLGCAALNRSSDRSYKR